MVWFWDDETGEDSPVRDEDVPIGRMTVDRDHSWPKAVFYAVGLALSVFSDIAQYSMPLAFLPPYLEDLGYSNMQIATAVGVYYWTGFIVTLCVAAFHIGCVINESPHARPKAIGVRQIRLHIFYALMALTGGTVSLMIEGFYPIYMVHVCCRFVQGGCGGIIFIFVFLTACELFKGKQQVFALTLTSIMFNVAEVLGPFVGAIVYDNLGISAVFYLLGIVSLITQVWFLAIILSIRETTINMSDAEEPDVTNWSGMPQRSFISREKGLARLKTLLSSRRFVMSVLLISSSAAVKGAVEECLPFHADHEWRRQPLQIGEFFSMIAVSYIIASAVVGQAWAYLNCGQIRSVLCAVFLALLGAAGWCLFSVRTLGGDETGMWIALALYGACLGFTFTPATLILGEAVENEDPGAAKDATNSIWNTTWEAGGSTGFLLGGLIANSYPRQVSLMLGLGIFCVLAAIVILVLTFLPITQREHAVGYSKPGTRPQSGRSTPLEVRSAASKA